MKFFKDKIKIFTVVTVVIALLGMVFLGIFGLNQTVDYSDHSEVSVVCEENFDGAYDVMKKESDEYFAEKGLKYQVYSVVGDGQKIVFKFQNSSAFPTEDDVDEFCSSLKTIIDDAFLSAGGSLAHITSTVSAMKVKAFDTFNYAYAIIGSVIGLVLIFVLTLIFEKVSGALTVVISAVGSAFLTFAFIALVRIPFEPFGFASVIFSGILGAIVSAVLVDRANKSLKEVSFERTPLTEIAKKAYADARFMNAFVSLTVLLFALIFIIIGPNYLRFMGLQLISARAFSMLACSFFEYLWPNFKKFNKSLKNKEDTVSGKTISDSEQKD